MLTVKSFKFNLIPSVCDCELKLILIYIGNDDTMIENYLVYKISVTIFCNPPPPQTLPHTHKVSCRGIKYLIINSFVCLFV